MDNASDILIQQSSLSDITHAVETLAEYSVQRTFTEELKKQYNEVVKDFFNLRVEFLHGRPKHFKEKCYFETIQNLKEERSRADWTRIGVVVGMLWYKLDAIINALKDNGSATRDVVNALRVVKR